MPKSYDARSSRVGEVSELVTMLEAAFSEGGVHIALLSREKLAQIRTCDLCLRRATLILRPKLSQACGSDSANASPGSPPAGFFALSPPNLRWRLFYPRRGQSGTLLCTGLVRGSELARYCMNLFGTAMLYQRSCGVIEGRKAIDLRI
jgi:hypothetical protein